MFLHNNISENKMFFCTRNIFILKIAFLKIKD